MAHMLRQQDRFDQGKSCIQGYPAKSPRKLEATLRLGMGTEVWICKEGAVAEGQSSTSQSELCLLGEGAETGFRQN